MITRARRAVTLALLALLAALASSHAQSTPGDDPAAQWIRPEEIPARADAMLRRLEAAEPPGATELALARIEDALPQLSRDLDASLERATGAAERSASLTELEDIRHELAEAAAPLAGWKEELGAEAKRVADVLDLITQGERAWSETRARPETAAAGTVVVQRVDSAIEALHDAKARLGPWRERVLALSDRVIDRVAAVDAALEKLRATTLAARTGLFVPDRPPLWARGFGAALGDELPRAGGEIVAFGQATVAYVARDPRPLVGQALIAGLLMFALGRVAARARARLSAEQAVSRAARLLERPYAMGLLLALTASPLLHPLAPRRFTQLLAIVMFFPAARIVAAASERPTRPVLVGLFLLLALDRVGLALQPLPTLERAVFLLAVVVGFGWIALMLRPGILGSTIWLRRAARIVMVGLALGLLAEIGGWTHLGTLLGRGLLASAIAALYVWAAVVTAEALLVYAVLGSDIVRRSHLIARNPALVQRHVERVMRWLGVGLWIYFVLTALGLRSAAAEALGTLLDAGVSVGALSLSVRDVLGFVLMLLATLVLAQIVTRVLEEDVYPRTTLPRGVPYALSTLIRYGFYSLGFLCALAAAGVRLDQAAILIGGLGIGIGLGLQDLVKNFAAGLTLLFERHVHVGDAVEMLGQGISGRVMSIGMRASMIRSWNGAEVVVPNADLVSGAVTNWTLSDRLCRIEVSVGVAYGTDPDRVVTLLRDAVLSDGRVLKEPPALVLFKGFGESSLDFVVRAWTDGGYELAASLTSDVGLAIHRTLSEAGIAIPFPQRDIHLASVSRAARGALSGVDPGD